MKAGTEDKTKYIAIKRTSDNKIIAQALEILSTRLKKQGEIISSPKSLIDYLRIYLSEQDNKREHFGLVYLTAKNSVIDTQILQSGTIDQTAVYPREIARHSLNSGAVSVILFHTHPSGDPSPSGHDSSLTAALKTALAVLNIAIHDHIIIADNGYYSFAENNTL